MSNNLNSIKRKGSNSSFHRSRAISTDSIDLNAASKGQDGRPQTHWASSDVNVPINYGDNALLHSIELQEEAEENILATRKRTGSVAHELRSACAGRRMTVESMENANFTEEGSKSKLRSVIDFLDALIPKLHDRVNIYSAGFCLLCLLAASRYLNHTASWFALFFSVVGIDLLTAILDKFLFLYFIDKIFVDHYDIAYLLHGFHGPLGLLFAVFCMGSMLGDIQATKSFPTNWDRFLSAMTFIILCLCGKNWYIRKQYISLLEKRFSDKLFTLETWSILLSMLSTTKPPKDPSNRIIIDPKIPKEQPTVDSDEDDLSKVQTFHPQATNEDIDKTIKPPPHPHYPHLGHFDAHFPNINMHKVQKPLKDMQKKVINVFADLVQATSVYNDDFVDDIDVDIKNPIHSPSKGSQTSTPASSTIHRKEDTINAALKQKIKKRKTFWELAARVSSNMGALNVMTYNGAVAIRRKFQAKDFGKNLYDHLSRGNKYLITHRTLEAILHETTEHLYDEEMGNKKNNNYSALRMLSDEKKLDSSTFLLECAIDLFDPLRLGYITEEQCVAALCLVYKQQRFAATSLNGYGELHHSLRGVIDFVFWTVMGVIMQAFIQLDVFSYILPFITILLTMSFALSSLLGNIFLAITFVFFMIPYEVGNKIFIGTDPNTRIAGFVQSVSLLHTTINTLKNESVKVPNHVLFSEKIFNLSESGGTLVEINIIVNFFENEFSNQKLVEDYIEAVKAHILANKAEWVSCFMYCSSINMQENIMTYTLFATHRESWHDFLKPAVSKTALIKYMQTLLNQMGIKYIKLSTPVHLVSETNDLNNYLSSPPVLNRERSDLSQETPDLRRRNSFNSIRSVDHSLVV